jgi:tetratricopeptide (TPR) repeat protein
MLSEPIFGKYKPLLISAALVLLILAAFEPLLHNTFIDYDNETYILDNPHIRSGFTSQSIAWAFTSGYAANWHPLTWLSHMADIELFGLNPLGHHLHNLFLHTLATLLLFWLLYKMTGSVWCSAFVAMFFGIHPLRVESVAWAAERKDVLSAFFWMMTLAAYLYYARRGGVLRYLLVIVCFALGLMAKPMLVTLPVILLILDIWPLKRVQKNIAFLALEKIPLFILALASCVITYLVQQNTGSMANAESLPWVPRFSNALVSYISYLGKIFWPVDLALLYPYPQHMYLWKPVVSSLLLMALSVFVIFRLYKQPYLAAGWLWYGVSLIPVIGLVQVGSQAMADRYTYLPSIGIAIMISWAIAEFSLKWPYRRMILTVLSGIAVIAMIAGTRIQITYWKDNITLYEHTLAVTQDNAIIHNFLGQAFLKQGEIDKAFIHLGETLRIQPRYADAHVNMGMILAAKGKNDQALIAYEEAIKLNPRCFGAYTNLATLKAQQGFLDEAAKYLCQSIDINPTTEAYFNLGLIMQMQDKKDEAIANHRLALAISPEDRKALWNLAICLHSTGNLHEAAQIYYKVIQLLPNFPEAISRLAWILATAPDERLRNPIEALSLARQACQMMEYKEPVMLDTLAAAYAANGQFKEAIEYAQKALTIMNSMGQGDKTEGITKRLELYTVSKPYIESPGQ